MDERDIVTLEKMLFEAQSAHRAAAEDYAACNREVDAAMHVFNDTWSIFERPKAEAVYDAARAREVEAYRRLDDAERTHRGAKQQLSEARGNIAQRVAPMGPSGEQNNRTEAGLDVMP